MDREELHESSLIGIFIVIVMFLLFLFYVIPPDYSPPKTSDKLRIEVNYTGVERKLKK